MSWTRHIFSRDDAGFFTTFLNAEFDAIKAAMGTGVGSGPSPLLAGFLGNGRLVGSDTTAGAPEITAPNSLALTLPAGGQWVQDGVLYLLEEDVTITDLPPNVTGQWGTLNIAYDSEAEANVFTATWSAEKPPAGSGNLGKISTGATTVTALDATPAEADVIRNLQALQALIAAIQTGGEGGGGEGGGTGNPYTGANPWLESDSRVTRIVIAEMLAALEARLTEQIESGGRVPAASITGTLAHRQAIGIIETGKLSPNSVNHYEGAYIARGLFGDGSADTDNHIVASTMTETDRGWRP